MEQFFSILQNKKFSGTSIVDSNLQYVNNYYLNETGESEEIVDCSNVRSFLSNENNQKITQLYYSFLSSSTLMNSALLDNPNSDDFISTAEFKAIFYDDEKLADSFNNFYNTSILRGISSNYSDNPDISNNAIRNQLLNGNEYQYVKQNIFNNYSFWSNPINVVPAHSLSKGSFTAATLDIYGGDRNLNTEERLVEIPISGECYFVNIFLLKRFTQTSRMAFETCNNIIYKNINANSIYSQNQIDLVKHDDYLNKLNEKSVKVEKSVDNSYIKTIQNDSNANSNVKRYFSSSTLIQCFVDPSFSTHENEFWTDNTLIKIY